MHVDQNAQTPPADEIAFDDFLKVDIRIGTVVKAEPFPKARKPSLILHIDFGPAVGVRKTSAQIATLYTPEDLIGRQLAGVVNFPPRQIGPMKSEVLTLGFADAEGRITLFSPDHKVPDGARLL
ncbi:tRNA-binding protein [Croceicoccus mobilis]|uniref:tRNA-binding protein n=1 Tax=Croceicoccus mobilis TaxID=1703339 RepID=A0A916Z6Y4_9SPHN|nr:tRNA-binding protein [Croceicoccus mobilis]GGD77979.1 tRNA-binding protein [Croceicoccus mobilis]